MLPKSTQTERLFNFTLARVFQKVWQSCSLHHYTKLALCTIIVNSVLALVQITFVLSTYLLWVSIIHDTNPISKCTQAWLTPMLNKSRKHFYKYLRFYQFSRHYIAFLVGNIFNPRFKICPLNSTLQAFILRCDIFGFKIVEELPLNGWQLAKMKKSIPDMSLP